MHGRFAIYLAALALSACGSDDMSANDVMGFDIANEAEAGESDLAYCAAVEQSVPRGDCGDLTRARAEIHPGAAAFNVPDPMRRGQTAEVHLIIDRRAAEVVRRLDPGDRGGPGAQSDPAPARDDPTSTGAAENPPAGEPSEEPAESMSVPGDEPPAPGQIVDTLPGRADRFYPPVGRHMRAELIGQGFDIVARTDAQQQIPPGGQATWIWEVTAREEGTRSLSLLTVAEAVVNGRRYTLASTPRVRVVTVEVSLSDRIWDALVSAPNWIKLLTAVIVALGGLLTAWYALPRRPGPAPASNEAAPRTADRRSGGS